MISFSIFISHAKSMRCLFLGFLALKMPPFLRVMFLSMPSGIRGTAGKSKFYQGYFFID